MGLLAALGTLTRDWIHGALPPTHATALCAANLTPLRKPDGGVRPVAVGETLRRMVGKALLATTAARDEISRLSPLQTGIGIRGAAEAVGMGCQSMVNHLGMQSGWVLLKVDLSNAFNSISRKAVLNGAIQYCPSTYNFLRFAYTCSAPLFTGGKMIWSREGTHQGCPLGPLGFALGIHPLIERLATTPGLGWQTWYLDDGLLLGDPQAIAAALNTLIQDMGELGLQLNLNKCELWGPGAENWQGPQVKKVPWTAQHGLTVLGVPVNFPGSTAYAEAFWKSTVEKLRLAVEKATAQVDPQCAHHLLRKCLDGCKVNHLLRATDCYSATPLQECDDVIFGGFEDLLGMGLNSCQRTQVSLPLSEGGFGLRVPTRIRPAARISALTSFYTKTAEAVGIPEAARATCSAWIMPPLQDLQNQLGANFDPITSWMGQHNRLTNADPHHMRQKWWSSAIGKQQMTTLLDSVGARDQVRILEQTNSIGSSFMSVPPSPGLHTIIPADEYRLAVKWWLGLPLLEEPHRSRCPGCHALVDPFGDHLLTCKRNNYTKRHAAIQEVLVNCLVECGQGVEKEKELPTEAQPSQGARLRPADLYLRSWESGMDVAVDLTISHGWSLTEQARGSPGDLVTRERWRSFLCSREREKHQKYDAACRSAGWSFRAMALGTWGGLGPEAAKTLNRIIKRAAGWLEGDLRASRQQEIRLHIGLTLMRHIWEMLQGKNFL